MTGAEITSLSSTIANGRPTFSCVTWANLRAPEVLNLNETIGSLVRWSKPGCASVRSSPDDDDPLFQKIGLPAFRFRSHRRSRIPAAAGPAAPAPAVIEVSTSRNVSLAVLPMTFDELLADRRGPAPAPGCGRRPGAGSTARPGRAR